MSSHNTVPSQPRNGVACVSACCEHGMKWLVHDVDSGSLMPIADQGGADLRPLANQLADRAAQLQQELQRLQVLQALQAHQASTAQGGHDFQADAGSQAAMARQTLVQQQLQDQVAATRLCYLPTGSSAKLVLLRKLACSQGRVEGTDYATPFKFTPWSYHKNDRRIDEACRISHPRSEAHC